MRLIKRGKVKDIYEGEEGLIFHFTDRVSAYDVVLPNEIPRKGEVLCLLAAYWFEELGVDHHMLRLLDRRRMLVKRLRMIPLECIVRGYAYGSYYERLQKGLVKVSSPLRLAERLAEPIFDPTTKSEEKDLPIGEEEIITQGILDKDQLRYIKETSLSIYQRMAKRADAAGFILADLKLEFGFDERGSILLADSIGPDEFRLWSKDTYEIGKAQESYDKQPIRDWLASMGYKEALERARREGLPPPAPPSLPKSLVDEVSGRYITAYERLTGRSFA